MKRYILTGAPGSGKTSLLHALQKKGYYTIAEAATGIIASEQAQGNKQPWKQIDFIDKIVALQKHNQIKANDLDTALQFFDRSPLCTYALCLFLDYSPTKKLIAEINRVNSKNIYQKTVFFIENLGFIQNTKARRKRVINYILPKHFMI